MKKFLVKVYSWEGPRLCSGEEEIQVGDFVVVKEEFGSELGKVEDVVDTQEDTIYTISKKANEKEKETFVENEEKKKEIIDTCKKEIKRLNLQMKLIDARISLEGSNATIAFTADERVDFRELVKNLSKIFHRSIRMHQIGSRDEARKIGGCGVCGRELCCLRFPGSLPSITIDMARVQQVAHRGSERISGICGRLMCCLSYEACQYKEMLTGMPELHSSVRTPEGQAQVIEVNAITQEVKVRFADGKILVFKKDQIKK